jgi:hypothetical protein
VTVLLVGARTPFVETVLDALAPAPVAAYRRAT